MKLTWIFCLNQDIIYIYNNKDIQLFCKDFIDISLKYSWNLILKVVIFGLKN